MLDVSYAPLPAMRVEARGYGAGGRDTPGEPNLLRLLVGEEAMPRRLRPRAESIAVIETVIDDSIRSCWLRERVAARGRRVGRLSRCGADEEGAHGRAMTVLCRPDLVPALRDLLFRETTTIGLRWRLENKARWRASFEG
jgi:pyridinium-3,5-bisthiocarboxylic acid mononucleotide nickel chelatase